MKLNYLIYSCISRTKIVKFIICVIRRSRETLDLCPKRYASAADGGVVSIMDVEAHTGLTVSTATNACEDALPTMSPCCFLSIEYASSRRQAYVFFLQPSDVIRGSSVSDHWWFLTSRCPSLSCPFCRRPWSEDEIALMTFRRWPVPRTVTPLQGASLRRVIWEIGIRPCSTSPLSTPPMLCKGKVAINTTWHRRRCRSFQNVVEHI